MEQSFKLRRLEDLLPEAEKEDIITVLASTTTSVIYPWQQPHPTVETMEQTWTHTTDRGFIEPWDFIRDQGLNYHLGNAVKYICPCWL